MEENLPIILFTGRGTRIVPDKLIRTVVGTEAQMAALMGSLEEGLILLDGDLNIVACNPTAASILGGDPTDLTAGQFAQATQWRGAPTPWAKVQKNRKPLLRVESRLTKTDGSSILIRGNAVPLSAAKSDSCPVAFSFSDITDEKARDRQLEAARESVAQTAKLKSEFLANVSHEIRTPINGILGISDLLMDTGLTESQKELVQTVRLSANHLLTVINEVLDYSQIEAGKMHMEVEECCLCEIAEDVIGPLALQAQSRGLRFFFHMPSFPPVAYADPIRIKQILTNLVENAVKFTHEGSIFVTMQVDVGANGLYEMQFRVRDTGIGISESDQAMIFNSFTQGDGSTTRTYGGTGLGLSLVKHLVEMMGGTVTVASTAGKGSEFSVTLPVRVDVSRPGCPDSPLIGERVLLVAPLGPARNSLGDLLHVFGCDLDIVDGLSQALERTRARDYSAILVATGASNRATVAKLKTQPGYAGCPIFETSSASQSERSAWNTIHEPFLPYHVMATICRALGKPFGPSGDDAKEPSLRLLVADDNAVNRIVTQKQLQKMGLSAELAENGLRAVALNERHEFDVILMDVQMPEMNGFEATAMIRQLDAQRGRHTFIIAMTARSGAEERDACLSAGMDDYLSKPVDARLLEEKMNHLSGKSEPLGPALNIEYLREVSGGDESFERDILTTFTVSADLLVADIASAVERNDTNALCHAAHALKGSSSSIGAETLAGICGHIENAARQGQSEAAHRYLGRLTDAIAALKGESQRLLEAA